MKFISNFESTRNYSCDSQTLTFRFIYLFILCHYIWTTDRYQMPISLLGLLACLGIWEGVRLSINSWEMEKYPVLQQVMVKFSLISK